jgi:predicted O-methyltransferase YrrM
VLLSVATAGGLLGFHSAVSAWSPSVATGATIAAAAGWLAFILLHTKDLGTALHRQTQAAIHMQHLPFTTVLPWSPWALAPDVAARLLRQIQLRDAKSIVECGSGVSTLLIARTLKSLGRGHVYAIEHDDAWASFVTRMLQANGVGDVGTVIRAPLSEGKIDGQPTSWYDAAAVRDALASVEVVDVLIVDGPPEKSGHLARAAALPFFEDRLCAGALILVDDLHRQDETEMVSHWTERYALQPVDVDREEGYGFFALPRTGQAR